MEGHHWVKKCNPAHRVCINPSFLDTLLQAGDNFVDNCVLGWKAAMVFCAVYIIASNLYALARRFRMGDRLRPLIRLRIPPRHERQD